MSHHVSASTFGEPKELAGKYKRRSDPYAWGFVKKRRSKNPFFLFRFVARLRLHPSQVSNLSSDSSLLVLFVIIGVPFLVGYRETVGKITETLVFSLNSLVLDLKFRSLHYFMFISLHRNQRIAAGPFWDLVIVKMNCFRFVLTMAGYTTFAWNLKAWPSPISVSQFWAL